MMAFKAVYKGIVMFMNELADKDKVGYKISSDKGVFNKLDEMFNFHANKSLETGNLYAEKDEYTAIVLYNAKEHIRVNSKYSEIENRSGLKDVFSQLAKNWDIYAVSNTNDYAITESARSIAEHAAKVAELMCVPFMRPLK